MNKYFSKLTDETFENCFPDEESCLSFLAEKKWKKGFVCRKCGHGNFCKGKSAFSRRCTKCKHEESATSHTIFHNCRIPLNKAFRVAFLVCKNPGVSTYHLSREIETRQMTCWKFKKKITQCLEKNLAVTDFEKIK